MQNWSSTRPPLRRHHLCHRRHVASADLALHRAFHEKLNEIGGSVRLSSIIDDLFDIPVAVVAAVQKKHSITYPTARNDLKKLEDTGIIQTIPNAPQISYFCPQILRITYEDSID